MVVRILVSVVVHRLVTALGRAKSDDDAFAGFEVEHAEFVIHNVVKHAEHAVQGDVIERSGRNVRCRLLILHNTRDIGGDQLVADLIPADHADHIFVTLDELVRNIPQNLIRNLRGDHDLVVREIRHAAGNHGLTGCILLRQECHRRLHRQTGLETALVNAGSVKQSHAEFGAVLSDPGRLNP